VKYASTVVIYFYKNLVAIERPLRRPKKKTNPLAHTQKNATS
jgi:hypothetical protein